MADAFLRLFLVSKARFYYYFCFNEANKYI